jgi:2-polyprenyl-6-hydroxyphenyl methylase/3-demethylubiquinone-9 3-methyltransferase
MRPQVKPLTDESYWTTLWDRQQHKVRHLRWAYVANRQLARLFHRGLAGFKHPALVELGCADSLWLPYLARNYVGNCYGVDFSELGCQLAQRNLSLTGAEGTIICEDVFTFAKAHRATFDFVYSMGLIEHFSTPHAILEEMYSLLKPGGTMLTVTPNLRGMYTPIARVASPKLLATHKVIPPIELATVLEKTGFHVTEYGYTGGPLKLSVVDYSPWRAVIGKWGHEVLCKCVNLTDIVVGNLLTALQVPNQQLTSPYVYALCTKPN